MVGDILDKHTPPPPQSWRESASRFLRKWLFAAHTVPTHIAENHQSKEMTLYICTTVNKRGTEKCVTK